MLCELEGRKGAMTIARTMIACFILKLPSFVCELMNEEGVGSKRKVSYPYILS